MTLPEGSRLDGNGYIVSDVSLEKIPHHYMQPINETVDRLKDIFPQQLHSVYVYGSVARGDALSGISDLDILAIFHKMLSPDESSAVKKLSKELSQKYDSLLRDVGIAISDYDYIMDPANYYEQAFLKEICVCVYGDDLGNQFGPYKLTPEIAISFNGDISEVLNRMENKLKSASSINEIKSIAQSLARKIIRTYYSMVMARSQIWSTRLHEQADIVIYHFPDKKDLVRDLQNWLEQPPTDRIKVVDFIKTEGKWVCENFVREARMTS